MELINTIEISPYDYVKGEYESPEGSRSESADEWNQFWLKCISDQHLGNLKAIKKGSYLVDINLINGNELEEIIKKELEDVELDFFEDQIGRLSGGIVIKDDNVFCIEPQCCGDIEGTKEWEDIFAAQSYCWNQLWVGHPWIFYKRNNGMVEFSDYTELSLEEFKEIKSVFKVSEVELKHQIEKIRKEQNEFELKILKILNKMEIPNAERISKLMTGNK
jgi:hypothetical protein